VSLYDAQGNLTGRTITVKLFTDSGELTETRVSLYNSDNRIIEKRVYDENGELTTYTWYSYQYNNAGELICMLESIHTTSGNQTIHEQRYYDGNYDFTGSSIDTRTFYYNADGSPDYVDEFWQSYDEFGTPEHYGIGLWIYSYNPDGSFASMVITNTNYSADGTRRDKYVSITTQSYYANGWISTRTYEHQYYDESDNLTCSSIEERRYDELGAFEGKTLTSYYNDGTVESIKEYDSNWDLIAEYYYDREYRTTIRCSYDADGNLTARTEDSYAVVDGRVLKTSVECYDGDGNLSWRVEMQHDADGNMIGSTAYDAEGNVESRHENDYDEWGYCAEARSYDSAGNLTQRNVYVNEEGRTGVESYYYDGAGDLIQYGYVTYDDRNNAIAEHAYNPDGSLIIREARDFDENDNCLVYHQYDSNDAQIQRIEYGYDDSGNLTSVYHYGADDSLTWYVMNEFDEFGNRILSTAYDADGNVDAVFTNEYTNDFADYLPAAAKATAADISNPIDPLVADKYDILNLQAAARILPDGVSYEPALAGTEGYVELNF